MVRVAVVAHRGGNARMACKKRECPPTIAAVEGLATAAGCQLVCSTDIIFAAPGARFCVPGSNNGGFCHTPGVALANKIHPRRALAMLLLAEPIDAEEALRLGMVTKITENLYADAAAAATKIARTSAHNTQLGKQAFYRHIEEPSLETKCVPTMVAIVFFGFFWKSGL